MTSVLEVFEDLTSSIFPYYQTLDKLTNVTFGTIWSRCESLFQIPKRFFEVCISYSTMTSLRISAEHLNENRARVEQKYSHLFDYINISSSHGNTLNGVVLKHPEQKNKGHALLVLWGIKGCYEKDFDRLLGLRDAFEMDVISINYRGVGKSSGFPVGLQDLFEDAEAMINWAQKEYHVPLDKLLVYGTSMGGALGIDVAASFAKKGKKLHLLSDRSFSNYFDTIKVNAKRMVGESWIFGEILTRMAQLAGWSLDSKKKLIQIIESDVDSSIVVTYHPDDVVIPYAVSLGKTVSELIEQKFLPKDHKVTVIQLEPNKHPFVHVCKFTDPSFMRAVTLCKNIFHEILGIQSK